MPSPRQLALEIQINEKASLDNFYVSKNNLKTINILKSLINQEDMAVMGKHIYYRQYVMTLQIKANPQFIYLYKNL